MTEVVTTVTAQIARALQALTSDDASFKAVSAALVSDERLPTVLQGPVAPAPIPMTQELVNALHALPDVFGQVQPPALRELTEAETKSVHKERETIKTILGLLGQRDEALKVIIRGHMALAAARTGEATESTELDGAGFPIVAAEGNPQRFNVPGTGKAWSLEYRKGSVSIDLTELERLYNDGLVTKEEYYSFTREVRERVFDEEKAFKAIAKDPALLGVLRQIVKKGRAGTSLFTRKAK